MTSAAIKSTVASASTMKAATGPFASLLLSLPLASPLLSASPFSLVRAVAFGPADSVPGTKSAFATGVAMATGVCPPRVRTPASAAGGGGSCQ